MVSFKLTNKSKDFSKHVVLAVFICIHQMIIRKCLLLQLSPFFGGGGGACYVHHRECNRRPLNEGYFPIFQVTLIVP